MELIKWLKNNFLVVILFIVAVWILIIKININKENNKISNFPTITPIIENKIENKTDNLISPTPTTTNLTTSDKKTFGNKTKEEILEMESEERDYFISDLSREEIEELDMTPDYDFSDFLPFSSENFIVEKFDYKNKKLTVKPLIDDKNKIKIEVESWLFYENGNNPRKIEIIWNE